MHPPRGSRQSKYRSAVAQKGPARHLTCRRAPGAGLSHSCQIGRRVKLYGLLPSAIARVLYLHGGVTRGKPPFYLRPAQAVWQLGLPATQGLHLVPAAPPHLQHADVRASHAKFQQRRLPRRAPSTGS